ncbi:IS21-like element helper ATPase IstB [Pseudotamlana carrageenivorans]|uniref:ATP-binding protein n=1 Tax=Pseudotamlana carrageenivorans TaxID=2069432 RepID=A0A2I7SKU1_9FLAO|nr:IS21-like element helper ATPase IstB [Tamlana carrageenivorans]AUS05389.1 ATP-binding protein [Tamlana carrageenivorans]AUS06535.1 ATP-binding protein [Tamlana carrageenivorans]
MNTNHTIEKLRKMRLTAMAELHHNHLSDNRIECLTPDQYLALLTDHQWEDLQNRKIKRLTTQAAFKQGATLTDINYLHNRSLDRNMFERLATLDFVQKKENLIITGSSGVGKSYIAQALGHQACMMNKRTLYTNTARLMKRLKLSKVDGTYLKELAKLLKVDLLILDDFGLQSFDNQNREALMDIIDERHDKKATIVASQIPVSAWYDIIGESTIADAILDRIVNSSHRINLTGESLRKGKLKEQY